MLKFNLPIKKVLGLRKTKKSCDYHITRLGNQLVTCSPVVLYVKLYIYKINFKIFLLTIMSTYELFFVLKYYYLNPYIIQP